MFHSSSKWQRTNYLRTFEILNKFCSRIRKLFPKKYRPKRPLFHIPPDHYKNLQNWDLEKLLISQFIFHFGSQNCAKKNNLCFDSTPNDTQHTSSHNLSPSYYQSVRVKKILEEKVRSKTTTFLHTSKPLWNPTDLRLPKMVDFSNHLLFWFWKFSEKITCGSFFL